MSHPVFVGAVLLLAGFASLAGFSAPQEAPACAEGLCAPHDVTLEQISD